MKPSDIVDRRTLLRAIGGVALAAALPAARATEGGLPLSANLQEELALAQRLGKALVVLVSLQGCPFCRTARDHFLAPLLRYSGQPVVQLDMKSSRRLVDAAGRITTHGAQVATWRIGIAPTVLFLGLDGREVASRLVGASIPDFYGAYLDQRVAEANRAVAS